jgi:hypothetical protein
MADIKNVYGILWGDIVAITGASAASVISMSGAPAPPPTQTATLSATKYGLYTATSTTSWTLAVNALSSSTNATSSLAIASEVAPTRTGTINVNTRINLQFDLSSYSTSSILSASLKLDVNAITTTATPNEVYVLDLGDTFDFPTLNNGDYSLVYQSGSLTEYATDTISTTGLYELGFSAAAITTANTYPSAYSMALLTYHDRNDTAPASNTQYLVSFTSTPELEITYQ